MKAKSAVVITRRTFCSVVVSTSLKVKSVEYSKEGFPKGNEMIHSLKLMQEDRMIPLKVGSIGIKRELSPGIGSINHKFSNNLSSEYILVPNENIEEPLCQIL